MTRFARTREVAMLSVRPFDPWAQMAAADSWHKDAKKSAPVSIHTYGKPSELRGRSTDIEVNV